MLRPKKNKTVAAYLMLLVQNGIYDVVRWSFLTVGHRRSEPDRQNVLMIHQLKTLIDNISGVHRAVLLNSSKVRNQHGAMNSLKAIPIIWRTFYYRIHGLEVYESLLAYREGRPMVRRLDKDLPELGRGPHCMI